MRYRQRDSKAVLAWISDSDYTHAGEVVCGLRHVYRGVWGCPAWAAGQPCSYCFLKGTVRGKTELLEGVAWVDPCRPCRGTGETRWTKPDDEHYKRYRLCSACKGEGISQDPRMAHIDNTRAAVERWLNTNPHTLCEHQGTKTAGEPCSNPGLWCDPPRLLNAGEYTDPLGWTPEQNPHLGMLLDLFSDPETNPHGEKLLLVSKAGLEVTQAHLERRQPSENVILSWSIGNAPIGQEPGWETVWAADGRWQASVQMIDAGWRVRWRVDPLFSWTRASRAPWMWCKDLVRQTSSYVDRVAHPERITLGTLRHQGGRVMRPEEERVGIYRQAIDGLRDGGYAGSIGLCKETPAMIRTVLGIEPHEMRCNCLP